MGGKKNPAKEAAAAAKAEQSSKAQAQAEEQEWSKGAKSNKKAEAAAEKAAEAARKKAEKDALRKEEEASLPAKGKAEKNAKTAVKKTRAGGLDAALGSFDRPSSGTGSSDPALNATGIDNALDALSLTSNTQEQIDRHPERRFPAAYKAYEERRLEEMKDDKGLRRNQKIAEIKKEFERHPDNPFNQVSAAYNASKAELKELKEAEKAKTEKRLASP